MLNSKQPKFFHIFFLNKRQPNESIKLRLKLKKDNTQVDILLGPSLKSERGGPKAWPSKNPLSVRGQEQMVRQESVNRREDAAEPRESFL